MRHDAPDLTLRRLQTDGFIDLSRIHRAIARRVEFLLQREGLEDITPAQANALLILFHVRRPLTARQLAEEMSLSEVTVGRFLKALQKRGWVRRRRDPRDSRAILVQPTDKAREALPRFVKVANALLDQAFAGFSREEVERMVETVDRVRSNLAEDPAPPGMATASGM